MNLVWDHDLRDAFAYPAVIPGLLQSAYSIDATIVDYDQDQGQPIYSFELMSFRSPEHEGVEGIVSRLKERLKYVDAQRFEIVDEDGRYFTYDHPGSNN